LKKVNDQYQVEIGEAEKAFENGDFEKLLEILRPLLEKDVPAAIRLNACFSEAGTPDEESERHYVEGIFKAAELGDPVAKYHVGVIYDLGEHGIPQDKMRASEIFKELAENGNPHCMWIYACELIWGSGSFRMDTEKGLKILTDAASAGSGEACMTMARFYHEGAFGFSKSIEQRDRFRELAMRYDETVFDPYA
jgi:TPR repeat protein